MSILAQEPWPLSCSLTVPLAPLPSPSSAPSSIAPLRIHINSEEVLNLNVTESLFETITDVLCALRGLPPRVPHVLLDPLGHVVCELVARSGSRVVSLPSPFVFVNRMCFPLHVSLLRMEGRTQRQGEARAAVEWWGVVPPQGVCALPHRFMQPGHDAIDLLRFRFRWGFRCTRHSMLA